MVLLRCKILGLLLSVSIPGTAQDDFTNQIHQIVKDTSKHFRSLYGKKDKEMDIFFPKNKVDGTTNGKVFSISHKDFYFTEVAGSKSTDSISTGVLFEKWAEKLGTALGNEFIKEVARWPTGFKAYFVKGYSFTHGHLVVTIEHFKEFTEDTTLYFVRMMFAYDLYH